MLLSRNGRGIHADFCRMMVNAGWQAIDLNDTCDHARFRVSEEEQLAYFQQVVRTVQETGLQVGQCHAPMFPCYHGVTEEALEDVIQCVENCIRIASRLRIPYTVVHPLVYDWNTPDPSMDRAWEWNVAFLRRICRYAEHTVVCLENMPGRFGFITNGEQMAAALQEAGIAELMVCLDTGHLISQNETFTDFFAQVGDRIRTTHIHDSFEGQDRHLLPYTGQGDWADFQNAMRAYGYTGDLNSESLFHQQMPLSQCLQGQMLEREILAGLMV